jgi:hypothetical protein
MPKMSPLDLKAMLASERADALAGISADRLVEQRADAMDLGDMRRTCRRRHGCSACRRKNSVSSAARAASPIAIIASFHEVVTKIESQLIAQGFDPAQIKALGDYIGTTEIETFARDSVDENFGVTTESANSAARLVRITEHYVRMDYEGEGRACLYQVITGGDQSEILRKDGKECITPFDAIPFATTTPVPIAHRFVGRSMPIW